MVPADAAVTARPANRSADAKRAVIGSPPGDGCRSYSSRTRHSPGEEPMRTPLRSAVVLGIGIAAGVILTRAVGQPPTAAPNPDSQYRLGPDSLPQDGVPRGEIRGPFTLPCNVYPGTQHTYWV